MPWHSLIPEAFTAPPLSPPSYAAHEPLHCPPSHAGRSSAAYLPPPLPPPPPCRSSVAVLMAA